MIYIFKKENGEQLKVNSIDSVKSLIKDGIIKKTTQVKKGLRGKWQSVTEIEELKTLFSQTEKENVKEILDENIVEKTTLEEVNKVVEENVDEQVDKEIFSRPKSKTKTKKKRVTKKEKKVEEDKIINEEIVDEVETQVAVLENSIQNQSKVVEGYSGENHTPLEKLSLMLGYALGIFAFADFALSWVGINITPFLPGPISKVSPLIIGAIAYGLVSVGSRSLNDNSERYDEEIYDENQPASIKEKKIIDDFNYSPDPELIKKSKKTNQTSIYASFGAAVFCFMVLGLYSSVDKVEVKDQYTIKKEKPSFALFDKFKKGKDLFNKKKFNKAKIVWLECANKGNSNCMYGMGLLYQRDDRLGKDLQKANSWFLKAANKGHGRAAYNVGIAYFNGDGLTLDLSLAEKYFVISHKKGIIQGTYALAILLAKKDYSGKNDEKSFYYTKIAADKGVIDAQFLAGIALLGDDMGAKKNYKEALKYLKLASEQGDYEARYWIGRTYAYDDNPDKDISKAISILEETKKYKVKDSYLRLSILYLKQKQYKKAIDVAVEGSNLGDDKSHEMLGLYYLWGERSVIPRNLVQSTKHFIIANKIKYNSKTADRVSENMSKMSSYQKELANNYADKWLKDNKSILNEEKFYKRKKDNKLSNPINHSPK